MTDPWRRRCPAGHVNIYIHNDRQAYFCETCRETYAGKPIDAKTGGTA